MAKMSRRSFLVVSAAAASARVLPPVIQAVRQRRVLTLVYDKSIGAMRAIDRIVP